MKWLVYLKGIVILIALSGCQLQNPVANTSTSVLGDFSPVGSYTVNRQHTFILPYNSSFYIANPVNNIITSSGTDVNALFAKKLKAGFSQHFPRVYVGLSKERYPQALRSANEMGAQFLIYGFIDKWSNIEPLQNQLCDELDPGCYKEPLDGEDASGEAQIAVSIYEAATGRLVDLISVTSQRGMASYFYEDNEGPLDQVVASMMETLSTKR